MQTACWHTMQDQCVPRLVETVPLNSWPPIMV